MKTECGEQEECPDLYGICYQRGRCELYLQTIGFAEMDDIDEAEAEAWRDIPVEVLGADD